MPEWGKPWGNEEVVPADQEAVAQNQEAANQAREGTSQTVSGWVAQGRSIYVPREKTIIDERDLPDNLKRIYEDAKVKALKMNSQLPLITARRVIENELRNGSEPSSPGTPHAQTVEKELDAAIAQAKKSVVKARNA